MSVRRKLQERRNLSHAHICPSEAPTDRNIQPRTPPAMKTDELLLLLITCARAHSVSCGPRGKLTLSSTITFLGILYSLTLSLSVVSSDRLQAKGLSNKPSWMPQQSNNANNSDVISGQATHRR